MLTGVHLRTDTKIKVISMITLTSHSSRLDSLPARRTDFILCSINSTRCWNRDFSHDGHDRITWMFCFHIYKSAISPLLKGAPLDWNLVAEGLLSTVNSPSCSNLFEMIRALWQGMLSRSRWKNQSVCQIVVKSVFSNRFSFHWPVLSFVPLSQ